MRSLPRASVVPFAALSLLLLAGSGRLFAADNDKIESKRVHFPTFDEVELSGSFYRSIPAAGKKEKDAVVLLLHDFRHAKGGSSQEDGWRQLAGQLQREGYSVLSFDFRGFGNSKSVSPKFWTFAHNSRGIRGGNRKNQPSSIDQKDFSAGYYLNLLNDIAAARAFLDVLNDAGEVNSSNILVVGAGQGATLGSLWMASECRRQRDPRSDRLLEGMAPQWNFLTRFDEPEGSDLGAAVWLTISPMLETRPIGRPLTTSLLDVGKSAKISTLFLYGKNDKQANSFLYSNNELKSLLTENSKKKVGVKEKAVPGTDLTGSKLLSGRLKTTEYLIDFLNAVLENRGSRTRKTRENQKYAFCWSVPWPTARSVDHVLAKLPGEPITRPVPLNVLGLPR